MSKIILDISANTFKNDEKYVERMIDEVYKIDTEKHEIIFKTQLFVKAGENIPLEYDVFDFMYRYAQKYGYKVTSSVFDLPSLKFLLQYDVPFVKIANNRDLDWLVLEVPRRIPVYMSVKNSDEFYSINNNVHNVEPLCCVSNYENAISEEYEIKFGAWLYHGGISDHTHNWDLYRKYKPHIYECHYILDDSTGLDAGPFARTPEMLAEVL